MGSQRDWRGGWIPFRVPLGTHWRVPPRCSAAPWLFREHACSLSSLIHPGLCRLSFYTFTPNPPWSLASQPPAPSPPAFLWRNSLFLCSLFSANYQSCFSEQSPSVPPPLPSDHPRLWHNLGCRVPLLLTPPPSSPPRPDWACPPLESLRAGSSGPSIGHGKPCSEDSSSSCFVV